jgi:hypothetical protein
MRDYALNWLEALGLGNYLVSDLTDGANPLVRKWTG